MEQLVMQDQDRNIPAESRLYYLDYLRLALVTLVVIHHIAMIYGAVGPFYYLEQLPITRHKTFQALLVFILFNQSFFMGALFFLSGYFTPGSLDRKGASTFLMSKVLRLGVPLAVFVFVLNPLLECALFIGTASGPAWRNYPGMTGMGPSWFVAMLLIFDFGYVLWRRITKRAGESHVPRENSQRSAVSFAAIAAFTVILMVVSYLWRIAVPLGKSVGGFPTLAYFPQYLGFFIAGSIIRRKEWLQTLPHISGFVGGFVAICAAVFLFPFAFSGKMFSLTLTSEVSSVFGNGHWRSAVYAAWDSLFSVGITLSLIVLFRGIFKKRSAIGTVLCRQSYAIYLIHTPVVVYMAYLLRGLEIVPIAKFFAAVIMMLPICYLAAYLVRRIPGVSKVI